MFEAGGNTKGEEGGSCMSCGWEATTGMARSDEDICTLVIPRTVLLAGASSPDDSPYLTVLAGGAQGQFSKAFPLLLRA